MQATIKPFPKKFRLNKPVEFRNLFQVGRKLSTRYCALYAKPNQLTYPRLGLILAKKNIRLAVDRNQFKRVIRESFRHNQQIIAGLDVLVMVYPSINTLDKLKFRDFLEQQWSKLATSLEKQ